MIPRIRLKMNDSKTEMIVFPLPRVELPALSVICSPTQNSWCDLGCVSYYECSYEAKTIQTIQNVKSPEALGPLVHAFVTARLAVLT